MFCSMLNGVIKYHICPTLSCDPSLPPLQPFQMEPEMYVPQINASCNKYGQQSALFIFCIVNVSLLDFNFSTTIYNL